MTRVFKSPEDFRRSLEAKLVAKSRELDQELERIRRKVAFERLLARIFSKESDNWLLKGGFAMELRFQTARATRDVDLMLSSYPHFSDEDDRNKRLRRTLTEAAARSLPDFFEFRVGESKRDLAGPIYGGARYPVEARIGGRLFVRFSLDLAIADAALSPVETIETEGWLADYGLPPVRYQLANAQQQFAEKLHAYTMQVDGQTNSRAKDLVDLVLLIRHDALDFETLPNAISSIFKRRASHRLPDSLPKPPLEWAGPFKGLTEACDLPLSLEEAYKVVQDFLNKRQILTRT